MAPHGYNNTTQTVREGKVQRRPANYRTGGTITKLLIFGFRTFLWHASAIFVPVLLLSTDNNLLPQKIENARQKMELAEVEASLQSPIESRTSKTNQLHRNTAIGNLHNVLIHGMTFDYSRSFGNILCCCRPTIKINYASGHLIHVIFLHLNHFHLHVSLQLTA